MSEGVDRAGLRLAGIAVADLWGGEELAFRLGQVQRRSGDNVDRPAGATWDHVVMQGFSTGATSTQGDQDQFAADAQALFQAVEGTDNGAGVTGVLFETWARHPDNGTFYPDPYPSAAAMQAEVRAGYELARAAIDDPEGTGSARVAPVGDAFEGLGFGRDLYDSDLYHASTDGSLLASLVLYRTIYAEDVSDIAYAGVDTFAGVNEARWGELTAAADLVAIPEPATGLLLAAGTPLLMRRRGVRSRPSAATVGRLA